jgi:hypothetical protein
MSVDEHVHVGVTAPLVARRSDARALVAVIADLAADRAAGLADHRIFVHVWDDLVRYEARRLGMTGALRAPLEMWAAGAGPLEGGLGDGGPGDGGSVDAAGLVGETDELLPSGAVSAGFGFIRRMDTFRVTDADGRRVLRVRVQQRSDLMPEVLASAIDTTLAVKQRFGRIAGGVLGLSFNQGGGNFRTGRTIGQAESATGTVFLSPNLVFADDMEAARIQAVARGPGVSASVPPPFTALEGVTAHELWHNLDAAIQVAGTYTEFNRLLGEALGVATLEHALRGGEPGAPAEWQAARVRLAREVSVYATTAPREATAEMFKLWWCSNGEVTPIVARFGELVDRFYPRP